MIMGGATALIGFLPTYETIGIAAPIALLVIRVLQGLALGGEYGGAAVYVAEHVPDHRRGFYTSFIQITATLGLFVSLVVILTVQNLMAPAAFTAWGWRIPFIISILLVGMSLYIRLRMRESPIFEHLKATGMTSTRPLTEAFTKWPNLKLVLISLFGATAGQGVVWYTGQFYALFYLQTILKVHATSANYIVAIALLLGMPFFVVFGALSDRIGRKRIMMAGCLLAAVLYIPIYRAMQVAAGSEVVTAISQRNPVTGAVLLTPMTLVDGVLQPARQSLPYVDFADAARRSDCVEVDPAGVRSGAAGHDGLRADRGVSGRGVSGEDPVHGAVAAVSHRQRRIRRAAAAHRPHRHRGDRQHLRRVVLPDRRGPADLRRRIDLS